MNSFFFFQSFILASFFNLLFHYLLEKERQKTGNNSRLHVNLSINLQRSDSVSSAPHLANIITVVTITLPFLFLACCRRQTTTTRPKKTHVTDAVVAAVAVSS